jgi:DNA-binding transcriptional MerR regulator
MRSAQVAAEAGVNLQTLRYYERRGLLPAPPRLESGYRAYEPDAVRTVRFVKTAQRLGFTLVEVESLLDLAAGGPANCEAARVLATEKVAELERKIVNLTTMRDSLLQLIATCERPRARRECRLFDATEHDLGSAMAP